MSRCNNDKVWSQTRLAHKTLSSPEEQREQDVDISSWDHLSTPVCIVRERRGRNTATSVCCSPLLLVFGKNTIGSTQSVHWSACQDLHWHWSVKAPVLEDIWKTLSLWPFCICACVCLQPWICAPVNMLWIISAKANKEQKTWHNACDARYVMVTYFSCQWMSSFKSTASCKCSCQHYITLEHKLLGDVYLQAFCNINTTIYWAQKKQVRVSETSKPDGSSVCLHYERRQMKACSITCIHALN